MKKEKKPFRGKGGQGQKDLAEPELFRGPISVLLLRWYDAHKRDLPWRGESPRDPYKVWVSEIMLQQTRVETVKDYYASWMEHFPDVASLAAAEEDEVLRHWQGLGYYSRARNLHTAAREVMDVYDGHIPETREEISRLKGIGEYTAGAILSFAYGKRETAVDGNVLRVFARLFNIEKNILSVPVKKEITALVQACQTPERPGDFNEALMDLGSGICIPGTPRCDECPLLSVCEARAAGREAKLPLRITKKEIPREKIAVCIACRPEKENGPFLYLLHRRPAKGLLAGMWEFPCGSGSDAAGSLAALQDNLAVPGLFCRCGTEAVQRLKHVFSHKIWEMSVYVGIVQTAQGERAGGRQPEQESTLPEDWCWVPEENLHEYTLAGPHTKILKNWLDIKKSYLVE